MTTVEEVHNVWSTKASLLTERIVFQHCGRPWENFCDRWNGRYYCSIYRLRNIRLRNIRKFIRKLIEGRHKGRPFHSGLFILFLNVNGFIIVVLFSNT